MPMHILAAARTPWARRHGPLAGTHPEELLGAAVTAAVERSGLTLGQVGFVLVACDNPVGAQAANLAQRVLVGLDELDVPALTVDGQGTTGLAILQLCSRVPGPVVVAAVDSTSIVAPGAALVRDYGRPVSYPEPDVELVESTAIAAGLDRAALDEEAARLRMTAGRPSIISVSTSSRSSLETDVGSELAELAGLTPLRTPDALLTAGHQAQLADGAVAVVLGDAGGRTIEASSALPTGNAVRTLVNAAIAAQHPVAIVDSWAVPSAMARAEGAQLLGAHDGLGSALALGSVPSADGLRVLVDALGVVDGPFGVVRRGRSGQVVTLRVAGAH